MCSICAMGLCVPSLFLLKVGRCSDFAILACVLAFSTMCWPTCGVRHVVEHCLFG